jgi:hypothetical protein
VSEGPLDSGSKAESDAARTTELRYVSINITDRVGTLWDLLVALPIEEVRREPGVVYVRTVDRRAPEEPPPVVVHPGESVVFEVGSLTLALDEIDRYYNEKNNDASLAAVLQVWLRVGSPPPTEAFFFILAAARRLDAALRLLSGVTRSIDQFWSVIEENRLGAELQMAHAASVGDLEICVVALGRAADMADKIGNQFGLPVALDMQSSSTLTALTEIRNAYEHVEDRALGQVRGTPHPDAHSMFDHRPLLRDRQIRYGSHSVTLDDLQKLGSDVRRVLKAAAADIGRVTPEQA